MSEWVESGKRTVKESGVIVSVEKELRERKIKRVRKGENE